tara:strand:- start:302 stop:442 length:141 start_codon:yes stop_codon:yes gene_type:complete
MIYHFRVNSNISSYLFRSKFVRQRSRDGAKGEVGKAAGDPYIIEKQ